MRDMGMVSIQWPPNSWFWGYLDSIAPPHQLCSQCWVQWHGCDRMCDTLGRSWQRAGCRYEWNNKKLPELNRKHLQMTQSFSRDVFFFFLFSQTHSSFAPVIPCHPSFSISYCCKCFYWHICTAACGYCALEQFPEGCCTSCGTACWPKQISQLLLISNKKAWWKCCPTQWGTHRMLPRAAWGDLCSH